MHGDAIFQTRGHMPSMTQTGKVLRARVFNWQFRQDRNPIVALLPPRHQIRIPKRGELFGRDQLDRAFTFLQTQDVGGLLL